MSERVIQCPACESHLVCHSIDKTDSFEWQSWSCSGCGHTFIGPEIETKEIQREVQVSVRLGTAQLVCGYCARRLDLSEVKSHTSSCAHDRINKLEARLDALSRHISSTEDKLINAGLIPECRP